MCAIVGVLSYDYIAKPMGTIAFALPFAVATATFFMMLTRTVHPPAGGTVAIIVLGGPAVERLGWGVLVPVFYSSVLCVIVALVVNNVAFKYPQYWLIGKRNHPWCL